MVTFQFQRKLDAYDFADLAARSTSVTGVTLMLNGKFAGARDGMGA